MTRYLVFIFLCCVCFSVHSQSGLDNLHFNPISMKSGLSSVWVRCIFQDSQGFIWVGTQDGLNRYDGYTFKTYRPNENDSFSIRGGIINAINEDSEGNLWVGTDADGLSIYNRKEDRFYPSPIIVQGNIRQILKDKKNNLWIVGDNIFYQWEEKNKKLVPHKFKDSDIAEGEGNELWLAVRGYGILVIDAVSKDTIKSYRHNEKDIHSLADTDLRRIIYDAKNSCVWLATFGKGLEKLDLKTQKFQHFAYESNNPNTVRVNQCSELLKTGDYIWIGTENGGLSIVNTLNNQFTHHLPNKNKEGSINDASIWALYQDREQRVWIGTFGHGLNVVDRYAQKFEKMFVPLENQTVNAILQDSKNRLWIGTEGGIAVLEGQNHKIYQHNPNHSRSLGNNPVLSIIEDSKKQIWVGTWQGGLNRFEEKNKDFTRYTRQENNAQSSEKLNVFSILETNENKLLVGAYGIGGGLVSLENQAKGIFQQRGGGNIFKLLQDKKGEVWAGHQDGLYLFDLKTQKPKNWEEVVPFNYNVQTLYQDSKERIWIGSEGGLYEVNRKEIIKHYTIQNGLPNNNIYGILEDKKGNLWLSTNNGLSCFNPEKQTFKNYDEGDGLQGDHFKRNACFKAKDGKLFFGGAKGLNTFYPDSIKDNPHIPNVLIMDLKIFNQSVKIGEYDSLLKQNISQSTEIYLSYKHSVFTLDFVGLNFTATEKNQYAYILEGFEKKWNYVGNQRNATYTNLDAGIYTFRVKASNNDGLWNEKGAKLIIHILPPWWENWWFRGTFLVLFLGSAIVFYKIRTNFLQKQNMKLEEQVRNRTLEIHEKNAELLASEEELRQFNSTLQLTYSELHKKNKDIHDSINASLRIQNALLPLISEIEKSFGKDNFFLLFKPRDIVSGDFYWLAEVENTKIMIVSDCTGHGVPGALMSMIGMQLLDKIVNENHITEPDLILKNLHLGLAKLIKQKETLLKEGMDMSVIALTTPLKKELKGGLLSYAGAMNPLYLLQNNELIEIKADKKTIGGNIASERNFTKHTFQITLPTTFYLFTDGFQDQFGGQKRRKFMTKQFRELLFSISKKTMLTQGQILRETIENWIIEGNETQTDDITVMGIRI